MDSKPNRLSRVIPLRLLDTALPGGLHRFIFEFSSLLLIATVCIATDWTFPSLTRNWNARLLGKGSPNEAAKGYLQADNPIRRHIGFSSSGGHSWPFIARICFVLSNFYLRSISMPSYWGPSLHKWRVSGDIVSMKFTLGRLHPIKCCT